MDEVWEGVYVMNPAPHDRHADVQAQLLVLLAEPARAAGLRARGPLNLGNPDDYRVPDAALRRPGPSCAYVPTAALVVEVVSPGDDTWKKLDFYAEHRVDELLIVDPQERKVAWLRLEGDGRYEPVERSGLIELSAAELAARLDWPD